MTAADYAADLARLEAELADLATAERARLAWDSAESARGTRPAVLPMPTAPTPPEGIRPDAVGAREELAALDRAHTLYGERAAARDRAKATADKAEADLTAAKAEATRCAALLSSVRRAPGAALATAAGALGDLGPVSLDFPDTSEGGPHIVVSAYGDTWDNLSTGQRIRACVYLRAGLRRATGTGLLPIIVDEAQSSRGLGDWPDLPAVVYLVSDDGDLGVVPGRVGA